MVVRVPIYLHGEEHRETEPDAITAKHRTIAFDDAFPLQTLHATKTQRRRQADPVGKLDIAQPRLGLQFRNDASVNGIKSGFWHICSNRGFVVVIYCVLRRHNTTVRKDMLSGSVRGCRLNEPTLGDLSITDTATHQALLAAVEQYFEMMFDSDVGRFDRVFAPTAQLHGLRDENLRVLPAAEYRNLLTMNPSPKSKGAPRQQEVLLVARHSDFDGLIPSQLRIGKFSGGTRISMLLGLSA